MLGIASCGPAEDGAATAPMGEARSSGSQRAQELGAFLASHFSLPIPAQGEPPAGFSEADRSLDPETCGACHPQQFADWQTTLHAGAFSPGFSGQLLEGSLSAPASVRSCQTCHVPLAEQQPWNAKGEVEPAYQERLRGQGLVCAGCHVRQHRRFGPPRRADAGPLVLPVPHGGFEGRAEFQQARFCGECHQFWDDTGVNGKPIENTFVEWQQSPQAAAGRQCQGCHMPDRQHLWRGIHHPETVRQAVDVDLVPISLDEATLRAALVLLSRDVGHAFPTYVTPRVFLLVAQLDAAGEAGMQTGLVDRPGNHPQPPSEHPVYTDFRSVL